jgi:hypothetical protein
MVNSPTTSPLPGTYKLVSARPALQVGSGVKIPLGSNLFWRLPSQCTPVRGVYALLLGSGISRSSAIPTGWEIVLDLIRKLAAMKHESAEPDPEVRYKELTGNEPDYSDILDEITKSSAERLLLLRSYFEATEEDRQQGRKTPSPAHRAIATLVAKGYIRVVVTTNFDRLLEQALIEVGIHPTMISTMDAVQGHSRWSTRHARLSRFMATIWMRANEALHDGARPADQSSRSDT